MSLILKGCKLIVKMVRVEGKCIAVHYVGKKFDFMLFSEEADKLHRTPNVCGFLYNTIPYLTAL